MPKPIFLYFRELFSRFGNFLGAELESCQLNSIPKYDNAVNLQSSFRLKLPLLEVNFYMSFSFFLNPVRRIKFQSGIAHPIISYYITYLEN